jgi:hypothetical protein
MITCAFILSFAIYSGIKPECYNAQQDCIARVNFLSDWGLKTEMYCEPKAFYERRYAKAK